MMRQALCAVTLLGLASCNHRKVQVPVSAAPSQVSYIDLEPGWRLRAIVPLFKSGRFGSAASAVESDLSARNALTLSSKADFLGYETQIYDVNKRGAGVRVRFDSATTTKNGATVSEAAPAIDLFELPEYARHVRLVFLQRASHADHNMAVLGAKKIASLAPLTLALQENPALCRNNESTACFWIPAGIAVRAEVQQESNGVREWVPAK